MDEDKQMTVDNLRRLLDMVSKIGYGDMLIFLGNHTPLLERSVCIDYTKNEFKFRNVYYDKAITTATEKMKNEISVIMRKYISDCYDAGLIIEGSEVKSNDTTEDSTDNAVD